MSGDPVLHTGLLQGRLPERKDFYLYYLELTTTQLHIFDGQTRKHFQGIRIDRSDTTGVETKVRKGEFRFYLSRPGDGRYVFKVMSEAARDDWIGKLERVISKESSQPSPRNHFSPENVGFKMPMRVEPPTVPKSPPTGKGDSRTLPNRGRRSNSNLPTPPPPSVEMNNSPRASIISTDSGIGTSVGGEVHRPSLHKNGSRSTPNSGSGMFNRDSSTKGGHSADAEFSQRITVSNEETPKWFWGTMNRHECEDMLKVKGEIGNFVVRVNATGHHIMSFWRVDGVHHHKILTHDGIWRFEKAAVNAEGESLADLLDTYMKNCTKDKNIKPYGGGLFENYTYAWAPQEFDMDLLGKKLKQQKELREKAAKKPRKKQEYTQVEIDTGLDDERGGFENDPLPGEEMPIKTKTKNKPLPLIPPTGKASLDKSPKPSQKSRPKGKTMGTGPQQGNTGLTLVQELAKRRTTKGAASSSPTRKNKSHVAESSEGGGSTGEGEACEPLYANTQFSPAHTKKDEVEEDLRYQNCDFDGPPQGPSGTPPASAGPPPPSASQGGGGGASSGGGEGESESQYQNVNYGPPKQQLAPATKKKPKAGTAGSGVGGRSPRLSQAKHMNGSATNNSSGEYQNFQFGKKA